MQKEGRFGITRLPTPFKRPALRTWEGVPDVEFTVDWVSGLGFTVGSGVQTFRVWGSFGCRIPELRIYGLRREGWDLQGLEGFGGFSAWGFGFQVEWFRA